MNEKLKKNIPVRVSGRHLHLAKEDKDELFGPDYSLTEMVPIDQPGQYATNETVKIKTEYGQFDKVRIVGPLREYTQVELARTDSYQLKIDPPLKLSGQDRGPDPAEVTIVGPQGEVTKKVAITAHRHLHLNPQQARKIDVNNEDLISVGIGGERGVTFHNVIVRVDEDYSLAMHIDTDEGNASGVKKEGTGKLIE